MTLFKGPLSYQEDNWFSFSLNFILVQFKFIPAEFKKIHFCTLTKTDARKGMISMYQGNLQICLCIPYITQTTVETGG